MSRRIIINGQSNQKLAHLAEEVVTEMSIKSRRGLRFDAEEGRFVYDGLDDHYNDNLIPDAESRYGIKLRDHTEKQATENAKNAGSRLRNVKWNRARLNLCL